MNRPVAVLRFKNKEEIETLLEIIKENSYRFEHCSLFIETEIGKIGKEIGGKNEGKNEKRN